MVIQLFKRKATKNKSKKVSTKNIIINKLNKIESSKKKSENLIEDLYEVTTLIKQQYVKEEMNDKEVKKALKNKKWLLKVLDQVTEFEFGEFIPTKDEILELNAAIKKHYK
tara:strand:+ start:318 stop:650 length:333 start_codon:yes stop_codon:yes gene_type:complete